MDEKDLKRPLEGVQRVEKKMDASVAEMLRHFEVERATEAIRLEMREGSPIRRP